MAHINIYRFIEKQELIQSHFRELMPGLEELYTQYENKVVVSINELPGYLGTDGFEGAFFHLSVNGKTLDIYISKPVCGHVRAASMDFGLCIVELPLNLVADSISTIVEESTATHQQADQGEKSALEKAERLLQLLDLGLSEDFKERVLIKVLDIIPSELREEIINPPKAKRNGSQEWVHKPDNTSS